ncbi:pectinesterase [Pseudovirgaria hyperparasitica]|uniref:Pectinesterase n=1 Tax=Pseudovirgaria hyperparasitica TaxID=470096 RepID=A0A6A6WMN7_9PEZI|nr:pectinesterase [Pseudovirgaria hyperparasitica]KAF2763412.1 pectinesterase [Pseudovirgaria hyperparasitica]
MQYTSLITFVLSLLLHYVFATPVPTPVELVKRAARTSTPSGCLTVRGSNTQSGEYATFGAALSKLGTSSTAAACIFVYSGTYKEQIVVQYKGALTIYGYTTNTGTYKSNTVILTYTQTSTAAGSLDASATANIKSANFRAYNINFVNGYGAGTQAVAVTANGNKQGFYGCSFKGYQDTLYAKSGFQYYSNCYIEGAVDYIFGDAAAWFGECTIRSNGGGYITANSREVASDTTWYVFDHSTVAGVDGQSLAGKVYLGRPWRVLARVIYQYNSLSNIINAAGWTTMAEGATPVYMEYQNTGDGSNTSARKYLTASKASVTKGQLWGGDTSWIDTSY